MGRRTVRKNGRMMFLQAALLAVLVPAFFASFAFFVLYGFFAPSASFASGAEENRVHLHWVFAREQPADAQALRVREDESLPVYLAPFEDARRPGDGQAAVSVRDSFTVLAGAGDWRMIGYFGGIGWIHVPGAERKPYDDFPEQAALLRLVRDADLTDDPFGTRRTALTLRAGETVTGLASVCLNGIEETARAWLYVQTVTDGAAAWLFIPPDAVEEVPMVRREGDTLVIREGVTRIGEASLCWSEDPDGEERRRSIPLSRDDVAVSSVEMETNYEHFDEAEGEEEDGGSFFGVRRIVLPDSVTALGSGAFSYGELSEFRFPDGLQYLSPYAFYAVDIGTVIIPAGFRLSPAAFDLCEIGGFFVEEGNPLYSSRDGVLFSADGTKLLWYPDGKKDLHYDVPAGVLEIADGAFGGNWLQTVSLPAGLRTIGDYAFSGCGRLNSLTVPLTVTELAENAFDGCVSLERLSLPPGLEAQMDQEWAEYGDFSWYNGDNGTTRREPKHDEYWEEWEDWE